MNSRETKEAIAAWSNVEYNILGREFRHLQDVEAERQRQSQSNASVPDSLFGNTDSGSDEEVVYKSSISVKKCKKSSISSIWFFFQIKKLQLYFSCNLRGPSITISGLSHIFSYRELKKATDCFKQEIGDGGFSSVYLGKLRDGRMVAVKRLYDGPKYVKDFINEVRVLSHISHPNLVSLYGCTDPGSQKLLLVYEFAPNGTIYDHLQGKLSPLSWTVRMQNAIETARALTYLHSLEPPLIHRDVKTSNILLDKDFHVKVADFGMCRLLPLDKPWLLTREQGTQGYLDPDYSKSLKLTAKSDVYSFGVVLLELISGEQAVDVNREESDIYLFRMAINKIMKNELEQLIDRKVGYHYESENYDCESRRMIDSVAKLACLCLQPEANMRPTMEEVLSSLTAIRDWTMPIECEPSKKE